MIDKKDKKVDTCQEEKNKIKETARKMKEKIEKSRLVHDRYFDFYDDVKDRVRGHEDW